jgi:hypothetical protein
MLLWQKLSIGVRNKRGMLDEGQWRRSCSPGKSVELWMMTALMNKRSA